jgi:hypothetical protein
MKLPCRRACNESESVVRLILDTACFMQWTRVCHHKNIAAITLSLRSAMVLHYRANDLQRIAPLSSDGCRLIITSMIVCGLLPKCRGQAHLVAPQLRATPTRT